MDISEKSVGRSAAAVAAIAGIAALVLAACSPGDYPEVLDKPTPRGSDPMSAAQIKAATDALLCDRDQLSADVLRANNTTSASAKSNASATAPGTAADCGQTAGVATKP